MILTRIGKLNIVKPVLIIQPCGCFLMVFDLFFYYFKASLIDTSIKYFLLLTLLCCLQFVDVQSRIFMDCAFRYIVQ